MGGGRDVRSSREEVVAHLHLLYTYSPAPTTPHRQQAHAHARRHGTHLALGGVDVDVDVRGRELQAEVHEGVRPGGQHGRVDALEGAADGGGLHLWVVNDGGGVMAVWCRVEEEEM